MKAPFFRTWFILRVVYQPLEKELANLIELNKAREFLNEEFTEQIRLRLVYAVKRGYVKTAAIRADTDWLGWAINCKVVPGISATFGAASSMNLELTLPGITQTLIITRAEFRTPVPEIERISELAKHGSTMIFYLSVHLIKEIVEELLKGGRYTLDTPAAVVYRATWKDEKIIKGKLKDIAEKTEKEKIIKTALIIVGNVLEPIEYQLSKVYDKEFTHGYRRGKKITNNNNKD